MDVKDLGRRTLQACRERGWAALETGISRPVPEIVDGRMHLWYLLYRSRVQPPYQMFYEPFARVAIDYSTGEIVEHELMPTSEPARVLGRYPHSAAAVVPRDQWQAIWDELFGLYPDVIDAFAGHARQGQHQKVARFGELMELTMPPFMSEYYRTLNPVFFDWVQQAMRPS